MKISDATLRNWQRLNSGIENRLQRGANKTLSSRTIYPVEYLQHKASLSFGEKVVKLCQENHISRGDAVFSLAVRYLEQKGLSGLPHAEKVLASFPGRVSPVLSELDIPENEADILGFIYQCLLPEGEKNISGSYYTPHSITGRMISDFDFSGGKTFFDPCCGSGAFLLSAPVKSPQQLWGCDKDPAAVFIAGINLICKFPDQVFEPQIFCCDYLKSRKKHILSGKLFDFIATNPPWGADKNRKSGESFALFYRKASGQLKENGRIHFLFPESVLRIKSHAEFRNFLLKERCLEKVFCYSDLFSGVMTRYVSVCARNTFPEKFFLLDDGRSCRKIPVENILKNRDHAFVFVSEEEQQILEQVRSQPNFYLTESIFALGIVTGDNKKKVSKTPDPGMEPVITGREVERYVLKPAVRFLHYDRSGFQQTAREEYYRAPEKLIYRFISGQPVFAYDNSGVLCLNSANILIPSIPGMTVKTVLAFLNSDFLRYYYRVMFGDIKILKGNLMQLPIPQISSEEAVEIDRLVDYILDGCNACDRTLQTLIYRCYQLSAEQIQIIEKILYPEVVE